MVKTRLSNQIAIYVSLFIFLIEGFVFVFSYHGKEKELRELYEVLEKDVVAKTGKHFTELHPGILDKKDITRRLNSFSRNILLLVIMISTVTSLGVVLVFKSVAENYLNQIIFSNKQMKEKLEVKDIMSEKNLPSNEISDLIVSRNQMIKRIIHYQEDIENEVKKLESQIIQSAKMSAIGEMTATIIHDIKNPLTSLDLQLQNLIIKKIIPTQRAKAIESAILKLKTLVERMGKFSRQSHFERSEVSIKQIIQDALSFVAPKLVNTEIFINANLIEDINIYADSIALQQVFTNLLSNAIDAVEDSPQKYVELKAQSYENELTIFIKDSGIGMDQDNLDIIFQAFYTTKPIGKGTGLGLSSVKRILDKHDAKIFVESTFGLGTEFKIIFPLVARSS